MPDRTPLKLAPGNYTLAPMRHVSVEKTADPAVVCLVLHGQDDRGGARSNLTLQVPIPAGDATELLRTLKILHAKGQIPAFPEGVVASLRAG